MHFYDSHSFSKIEVGVLSSDSDDENVTRFGRNVVTKEDALGYLRIYMTKTDKTETTNTADETERVAIMAL